MENADIWISLSTLSGDDLSKCAGHYATGTAYSGMNTMLLWRSVAEQGFGDSRWMTYKQVKAEGGQLRKGEHGTTAIFYTTLEK
ncbi:antirestriction protein ArdC [Erwinia rhapontici]|nr:antirestriction protein ArdC [Erwinia rhapontici]